MATAAPESHLRENPFRLAQQQLHKVADTFGIDDRLVEVLKQCKKTVEVSIPTSMDDGSVRAFVGYRVTHNIARGPSKGGIRYPVNARTEPSSIDVGIETSTVFLHCFSTSTRRSSMPNVSATLWSCCCARRNGFSRR